MIRFIVGVVVGFAAFYVGAWFLSSTPSAPALGEVLVRFNGEALEWSDDDGNTWTGA